MPAAFGAVGLVLIFLQILPHPGAIRFAPAAFNVGNHAFKWLVGLIGAQTVIKGDLHLVIPRAEQDDFLMLLRQTFPRFGCGKAVMFGERFQRLHIVGRRGGGAGPGRDRPVA